MDLLGIETSCDETSAAVVRDGKIVLSNIVVSSLKEHQKYGGVIPEIASRRQMEFIQAIVERALKKAGVKLCDIGAIAVAREPGLIGSLLVGISFARALSFALDKPLIEVNHIKAHLYAPFLSRPSDDQPRLPAVGLVVSGGHTSLYHIRDYSHFKMLGQTLDDAAGEAFDKVSRILGLGYPGGPMIDRVAKGAKMAKTGAVSFKCAALPGTLDFSFSGIKTAVLYYKQKNDVDDQESIAQVARAFQHSVIETLVDKCIAACHRMKTRTLVVGGGVAANSSLRARLAEEGMGQGILVYFPPIALCMDNAAMIAGLGFHEAVDR
jgi:N6-L-threonylcarbamoyladenine synthase